MYLFELSGYQWYSVEIELGSIGSPIYLSDYLFPPFGSPLVCFDIGSLSFDCQQHLRGF